VKAAPAFADIPYGGSVKPPSKPATSSTLPGVGGALVGGASLKAVDFEAIIRATPTKA
jgi:triosephosphate isomerase